MLEHHEDDCQAASQIEASQASSVSCAKRPESALSNCGLGGFPGMGNRALQVPSSGPDVHMPNFVLGNPSGPVVDECGVSATAKCNRKLNVQVRHSLRVLTIGKGT